MSWTQVLPINELTPGTRKVVKVNDKNLLILNHEGNYYAVANSCPHLKLPIKKGKITPDGSIVCPFHRSAFDLKTGEPTEWITWPPVMNKAMGLISKQQCLPVFATKVEGEQLWVDV